MATVRITHSYVVFCRQERLTGSVELQVNLASSLQKNLEIASRHKATVHHFEVI